MALVMLVVFTLTKALGPRSKSGMTLGWDKADHVGALGALASASARSHSTARHAAASGSPQAFWGSAD
jgi:hypothetical protein